MTPVYIHTVNRWSNAKEKNISVDSRIIAIVRLNWSPYEEELNKSYLKILGRSDGQSIMFLCSEYLTNDQSQTSHVREVLMTELADKHTFDFQVLFIDNFVNFKKWHI